MNRFLLTAVAVLAFSITGFSQDYSNRGLMDIKEQAEDRHGQWDQAFEVAVEKGSFASLAPRRQENERFLDHQIIALKRLFAQGDGRALLTTVTNYLQIQKQYVKDVMIPAEKLTPTNKDGIEDIRTRINQFSQKEKVFIVEINNALRTEREDVGPAPIGIDPATGPDEVEEEQRGSVIEGKTKIKRKGKLPHEVMDTEGLEEEPRGSVVEERRKVKKKEKLPHEGRGNEKNKRKGSEDDEE
jgi:hypothetical protein